jgi:hypothetical protein
LGGRGLQTADRRGDGGQGAVEIDPAPAAEVVAPFEMVRDGASVRQAAQRLGWRPNPSRES